MIKQDDIKESTYSLFGKGSYIKGNLTLVGNTHIYSTIEGDITHTDGSNLILEYSSKITGNIQGTDIVITGTFKGNLTSTGKVIIQPTAHVTGQIDCKNLIVQPGAFLEITGNASDEDAN